MSFYVYIDWTRESPPRPFYVGKGSNNRINVKRRNWKHRQTRLKLGLTREIVFQSSDEMATFSHEEFLIDEFHTFVDDTLYNGIGCNFTRGGDGGKFPSINTRNLIRESNMRRKGEKRSLFARANIKEAIRKSIARRGKWKLTEEHRANISKGNTGRKHSEETREKLRIAALKQHAKKRASHGI